MNWITQSYCNLATIRSDGTHVTALTQLQDCFSNTVWDIFKHQNLQEYTDTVLSYIKNCVDTVTVSKRIRVFPNQKPWMTSEVQALLKLWNSAFRSGNRTFYSAARAALRRGIKEAKEAYKRKIEEHFTENNPMKMWQGIQHITNYKDNNQVASLAEDLNRFFACSETVRPDTITPHQPLRFSIAC